MIDEWQKLIRLADSSEHGWGMVEEYMVDDLAENSHDEKRIEKAERAAELKAAKRRKKRSANSALSRPRGGQPRYAVGGTSPTLGTSAHTAPLLQHASQLPRRNAMQPGARPIGPCHFCGKMGHLRLFCPAKVAIDGKK